MSLRHKAKYNIQNIGIFLWRLGAYSLTDSPAFPLDAKRFLFTTARLRHATVY